MIDWVVIHQAMIREVINGYCMVLFLTLTVLVMIFMWDTWVENSSVVLLLRRRAAEERGGNTSMKSVRDWREVPGIKTACALWWVFSAETYRTGAIWYLYNIGKSRHMSPYPTANAQGVGVFGDAGFLSSAGYLVAGFMLAGGLLSAIYIFTPPQWKRKVWVYAAFGGVVFCSLPSIVTLMSRIYIDGF